MKNIFKRLPAAMTLLCLYAGAYGQGSGGSTLPGMPGLTHIDYSFTRHTHISYALEPGVIADSLHLMDRVYLKPVTERWAVVSGSDASERHYRTMVNLMPHPPEATLGYKISHIVSQDTCTDIYDHRNVLVRHTSHALSALTTDTTSATPDDDWDEITVIRQGVTRYVEGTLTRIEDLNSGSVSISYTDRQGTEIRIFENRNISDGELGSLNYKLTAIPMTTPTGLCVTQLIAERYSDRSTGIEARSETPEHSALSMALSPNPTTTSLGVQLTGMGTQVTYRIFDLSGSEVTSGVLDTSTASAIDISRMTAGVYILTVRSGTQVMTEKFIKL